jgi:hypothetical protein
LLNMVWTVLRLPLTVVPRFVTIVTQAARIRTSMTAYSAAVGPSSLNRNVLAFAKYDVFMIQGPSCAAGPTIRTRPRVGCGSLPGVEVNLQGHTALGGFRTLRAAGARFVLSPSISVR